MNLVSSQDPLLHKVSHPFTESVHDIKPFITDLIRTMNQHSAVGISACQVGVDLSIFAMNTGGRVRVCINPQIVGVSSNMIKEAEGCLSYPGLNLKINRPDAVVVKYMDLDGNEVVEHLDGFDARVWLHEFDHLQGVTFVDRVSKLVLSMARKKLTKTMKRSGQ